MRTGSLNHVIRVFVFVFGACFLVNAHAAPEDHFVTTWKTDNPGMSSSTSITVPMVGGPYDVDWNNDGVFDEFGLNGSVSHDFGIADTYTIRIQENFDSIRFADGGDKLKILSVDQWGTNSWTSMAQAFEGARNLEIPASDTPDFSSVTSFNRAFMNAQQVNADTSNWDTSAAVAMSYMFFAAKSANPDTSNWDTSKVTSMYSMFNGAEVANPNTSNWDTSKVVDMTSMFYNARSANPDTSNWSTGSVVKMGSMFANAFAAKPDTRNWDTSSVTEMDLMFFGATLANPDVSTWDTSSVVDMHWMFWGATQANPDVSDWDTSKVTDMRKMFNEATSFDRDIGSWNVTSLTEAGGMFDGVTLSTDNYENLLVDWNAQTLQPGVIFSGGNSTFCSDAAVSARSNMIVSDSWVITDGGHRCDLIFSDGFESENIISIVDDPINNVGQESAIAIGADGKPIISYWDSTAGSLKVAKCNDLVCSGSDEIINQIHESPQSVGTGSSIAVGLDGLPVISYSQNLGDAVVYIAKCNDPNCEGNDETISSIGNVKTRNNSLVLDGSGFPRLIVSGSGGLQLIICNDLACSGNDETISVLGGANPQERSFAIPSDGKPVVSFYEGSDGSLQVIKCNDSDCTGGDELISVVDDSGLQMGVYNDLAIGQDGLPIICYNDNISQELLVAKCNDAACSGNDELITIVDDSPNYVGPFCSIEIGSDGLPVIAYVDSTDRSMKIAKCNDDACSGGDETFRVIVDSENDSLMNVIDIDLAIGADGLPIISFFNSGNSANSALMTIHCGSRDCG